MKRKNKGQKIKTIALAGGLSVVCLSGALVSNAGNCKSLFYPVMVKSATQDLANKELTQSYYKLFEKSLLSKVLVEEFNSIKELIIEETKTEVIIDVAVNSDKVLENERELYKKVLNDLFNIINAMNTDKNVIFEVGVNYKIDEDGDLSTQCMLDVYRICKNKFDDNSLAIKKTKYYNVPGSWTNRYSIYNVKEESFKNQNVAKGFEDEVYNEAGDSFYPKSRYDFYPYEIEKKTYYKGDSKESLLYLEISDEDFSKMDSDKLMNTLLKEISSKDEIEKVSIGVCSKDKNGEEGLKFYSAVLEDSGNGSKSYIIEQE